MKLSRVSTAVAAAAIAPAVLFSAPAFAADDAASPAKATPDAAPDARPDGTAKKPLSKDDDDARVAVSRILADKKGGDSDGDAATGEQRRQGGGDHGAGGKPGVEPAVAPVQDTAAPSGNAATGAGATPWALGGAAAALTAGAGLVIAARRRTSTDS